MDLLELLLYKGKALPLRSSGSLLYAHLSHHLQDPSDPKPDLSLFARLLHCPEEQVPERLGFGDRAGRVKGMARQLYDGGFLMEAGAVLVSSQSFHSALSTLSDSLAYVTEVLRKQ